MSCVPNPLIPMFAVTGNPNNEQIRARLMEFRRAGIEQVLIYPRSGCEIEYLSSRWFEVCRNIIDLAAELKFTSVWLYDEFNWPSGQCGGAVQRTDSAFGLATLEVIPESDGRYTMAIHHDPRYPNLLEPEPVELFMRLTHYRYHECLGSYFGTLIKGFFTDEPSPGYTGPTGREDVNENGNRIFSYYHGLEEDYAILTGREMCQDFDSPCFVETHARLIGRRFRENYLNRLRLWCETHRLLLTGHLNTEHRVKMAKHSSGDPLLATCEFSLPGIDEINTATGMNKIEFLTFATIDYAARKKGRALAELFALGPCDLPLAIQRQMLLMAGMFSVNHFVLAVSQLDFRGNIGKPNWFNPYSEDQPWFATHMMALGEAAKTAASLAGKPRMPEIAVRYPEDGTELDVLLKSLTAQQLTWRLIGRDDEPEDSPVVLTPFQGNIRIGLPNGRIYAPEAVAVELARRMPRRFKVETESGEMVENVLVREYADGTLAVLSLALDFENRRLALRRNGCRTFFELPGRGLKLFPGWQVRRDREMCLNLLPGGGSETQYILKESLSDVRLFVRACHDPVEIAVDGEIIAAEDPAGEPLPLGFRGLYRSSKPFSLTPGTHSFTLCRGKESFPYMPAAWLAGDFINNGGCLGRDPFDGTGLQDFSGQLCQRGMIELPESAGKIGFDCDLLCSELRFDGESMGTRSWPPFEWNIPGKFKGRTVSLELIRRLSVGPLFGAIQERAGAFSPGAYGLKHPVTEAYFI